MKELIKEFLLKNFGYEENELVVDLYNIFDDQLMDEYNVAFNDGAATGYDEGYDKGCSDAYDKGYDDGYSSGYDDGEISEH